MTQDAQMQVITEAELSAYCDGELPLAEARRVEDALAEDSALRAELSRIAGDRQRIAEAASLAEGDTEPGVALLADRLADRLAAQRLRRTALRVTGGTAAAAVLVTAGWTGHVLTSDGAPGAITGGPDMLASANDTSMMGGAIPHFVADAVGAHNIFSQDTVHPVEFFADDEKVMRDWFAAHLGKSAMIPHLDEVGFGLIGGRLLGDSDGVMAQLLYENDRNDRVSLIFSKRPVPGGSDIRLVHVGKSYASYWRDGDMTWAVVEDTPGADVSQLAHFISSRTKPEMQ